VGTENTDYNLQTIVNQFIIKPHGATSKKTAFFIVTAVRTANPAYIAMFQGWAKIDGVECAC
jgi:hypothetical protein